MKTLHVIAIASLLAAIISCTENSTTDATADAAENAIEGAIASADNAIQDAFNTEPTSGANYGAGVAATATSMSAEELVEALAQRDSLDVVVQGEVVEVCQKKGCWMTLKAPALAEEGVTVRFKDYGFFMPKGLSGSQVVVEGEARRTLTSVDDLRHYAEDAGKSAEEIAAIVEPKEELEVIATGVRVL